MTDAPEAIVKLVGYGNTKKDISEYIKNISRNLSLSNELISGDYFFELFEIEEIYDLVEDWSMDFSESEKTGKPRNTVNLILSAPKGSHEPAVFESARLFAKDVFGRNYEYIMFFVESCHTGNPHVHFVVKVVGRDLSRFTIDPDDFYQMRKIFAYHCSENGVPMKATKSRLSK